MEFFKSVPRESWYSMSAAVILLVVVLTPSELVKVAIAALAAAATLQYFVASLGGYGEIVAGIRELARGEADGESSRSQPTLSAVDVENDDDGEGSTTSVQDQRGH